jgi:hypothetical protein
MRYAKSEGTNLENICTRSENTLICSSYTYVRVLNCEVLNAHVRVYCRYHMW